MKNLLPFVLVACCSVACVASSADDKPSKASVQKGPQDPQPTPPPDQSNPQDDPSDQEGPSCNDPTAVTPEGWTFVDAGAYDYALPPGAVPNTAAPGPLHIWYVLDAKGKVMGNLQVASLTWASSLDDVEKVEKDDFTVLPDGSKVPSPLTFTRSTHECREDLVAIGSPLGGNVLEWHTVMVGSNPIFFGCDLPPTSASMCASFVGAFHVE